MKIAFFNATQSFSPYIQGMFSAVEVTGKLATAGNAMYSIYDSKLIPKTFGWIKSLFISSVTTEANTVATSQNTLQKLRASISAGILAAQTKAISAQMMIGAIMSRIQANGLTAVARSYAMATLGANGFKIAMNALGIGLVITAVVALVAIFKHLWDNSKRFREILFGIWEAAKAVFHNIGVFFKRVWDMVIKPIIMAYYNVYKFVFTKIWEFIKWVFNGIAAVFVWLYEVAVSVFTTVREFVVGVFQWIVEKVTGALAVIGSFFSGIWEWFSSVFSGFVKFIDEWLVQPIKNAFSGVWDWIVGIFEKIMDKLTGVFAPIKKFFKTLFSSEGMTDVKAAYKDGEKKGAASYDKDHPNAKEKPKATTEKKKEEKPVFDVTKGFQGGMSPTKPIAGVGAKEKKEGGGSGGQRSLTIGKLVENLTVHYHGAVKESAQNIKQIMTETLLTAVNDVNLAN